MVKRNRGTCKLCRREATKLYLKGQFYFRIREYQKAISFCVAVTVSYFLNKRWTFGDTSVAKQRKKLAQFFGISIMGALINVSVATAVVTYVRAAVSPLETAHLLTNQLWVNIGALCGTGGGLLWNFLGYKYVVFDTGGLVSSSRNAGGEDSDE